jgi:novobiocin biosynthesis protein NovU/D-mycarose 3-C-methyltransferase
MREHFESLLDLLQVPTNSKKILEVGSNDGLFLEFLHDRGHDVLGIDPSENQCARAAQRGLNVYCDYFGLASAADVVEYKPDFIIARHVFCHVEDWADFLKGLERLAQTETVIAIEVPYVGDLLDKGEFDTIYHEHTSYLSIKAVSAWLKDSALQLSKIIRLPIHGGAVLLILRRRDSAVAPDKSVSEMFLNENCGEEAWREFDLKCHAKIGALQSYVAGLVHNGKRVVGYGASAKSTVWLNAAGFSRKEIAWVSDTTPEKLYRLCPGTDIPVVDEGSLTRELPDYAVIFAWNYRNEIIEKEKLFLQNGGKFIVPHPEIQVVP